VALLALTLAAVPALAAARGWPMRQEAGRLVVETPHYVVQTDHEPKVAQLVASHQEALFRELYGRMGKIKPAAQFKRMLVRVFTTEQAYKKAMGAGAEGSQGLFTGSTIGGYAPADNLDRLLSLFRHEGTHQFVQQFIGTGCPVWLNEGLAVYFQEGEFKEGKLVVGQVPKYRLRVIQTALKEGKLLSMSHLLAVSYDSWNAAIRTKSPQANIQYAQAWSVVHFLEHADNGKYRAPFMQYVYFLARNRTSSDAWAKTFGGNMAPFEARYRAYVSSLKPTSDRSCREKMGMLAKWIIRYFPRSPDAFTDIATFRDAAVGGKLGYWTVTDPGSEVPYEIREPEAIADLFRCPDDASKGDAPSYELVPQAGGGPPGVRCSHHAGFVLETVYEPDPENPNITNITITSKAALPGDKKPPADPK
jgi:hypothetical protein